MRKGLVLLTTSLLILSNISVFLIFATQAKAQALEEIVTTVDHEPLNCATFYDSLNNLSSINASGGVITGTLTFVLGVNDNAANFDGSSYITYTNTMFNSESGSISLWFKKNSADTSSGIVQIGHLGQPNSLGLFYNYQDNLYFEIKDNNGYYEQAYEQDVLSESEFVHVVIIWDKRVDEHHIKLFVNGEYVDGDVLSGTFIHNQGYMDLGRTGWYGNSEGIIDEVRFFNWALSDPEVYAEYVYSSNRFRNQPTKKPVSTGKVQVIGKSLYVDRKLFKVKGVGYQPVPIGSSNTQATLNYIYTNPDIIERDVTLLRAMNVNVVRFWGELNDTVLLDALYNEGVKPIYAIMAFEVPWSGINYGDPSTIAALEDEFRDYVQEFKGHPAVLAWAIGNENNLHYKGDVADWFVLANRLAKVAYEEEGASYHPTMVINGYMLFFGDIDYRSDDISMNYTDVWGHNSYTGYEFDCYFDYYDTISAKPLVLTEFGIDAYNTSSGKEYQEVQAEWTVHQWQQIVNNSAGGILMEYCDEWWKAGYPSSHNTGGYYTDVQPDGYSDEEWWGIMRTRDNGSYPDIMEPRVVYDTLQSLWRIHDIAVTKVMPSKTVVGQGYSVSINVTIENRGDIVETFNVTVFYDETVVTLPDGKNHTTTTLTSGDSTTLTIPWNTTGVPKGNYTISAYAEPVLGETDIADNTYVDGWVVVTIPGAHLVVRGLDNRTYYRIYHSCSDSWGSWNAVPTGSTCDSPAAAVYSGRLCIVVRGMDGSSLWFGWINLADNSFHGWNMLSGATPSAPTLVCYDDRLVLMVRGLDNRIYYRFYHCVSGEWEHWLTVPTGATRDRPAATVMLDYLHIVVRGMTGGLYHGQVHLPTGEFYGWTRLAGDTPSAPALTTNYKKEEDYQLLYLVVRGMDDRIYWALWDGSWTRWKCLPGATCDAPGAAVQPSKPHPDARLHLVVKGMTGRLYHGLYDPNSFSFLKWTQINGDTPSQPALSA